MSLIWGKEIAWLPFVALFIFIVFVFKYNQGKSKNSISSQTHIQRTNYYERTCQFVTSLSVRTASSFHLCNLKEDDGGIPEDVTLHGHIKRAIMSTNHHLFMPLSAIVFMMPGNCRLLRTALFSCSWTRTHNNLFACVNRNVCLKQKHLHKPETRKVSRKLIHHRNDFMVCQCFEHLSIKHTDIASFLNTYLCGSSIIAFNLELWWNCFW